VRDFSSIRCDGKQAFAVPPSFYSVYVGPIQNEIERIEMRGIVIAAAAAAAFCTAASAAEKQVQTAPFTAISVAAGVQASFEPGPQSITIIGSDRAIARVVVENRAGTLVIRRKPQSGISFGWGATAQVRITGPAELSGLSANSGASLRAKGVKAQAIALEASSGGVVRAAGSCTEADIKVSSGGALRARDMQCAAAKGEASSGGSASLYVSRTARGSASSGGSLRFFGPGELASRSTSSGGSVSKAD
jgi:hypothetical protein